MKIPHNKLVRDNIPDIIKQNNKTPQTKVLEDKDYIYSLKEKLLEEANEVYLSKDKQELVNELTDVLEVVEALMKSNELTLEEVLKHKETKAKKNGKFDKKIYLEYVEE